MDDVKRKRLSFVMWIVGALLIGYGMNWGSNVAFVIGILVVIGGYMLIRERIKEHIKAGQMRRPGADEETEKRDEGAGGG
jgi:hypothetical protein